MISKGWNGLSPRRSSCLWFQLFWVEMRSFLPQDESDRRNLSRQGEPSHCRSHPLGEQALVEIVEWSLSAAGHGCCDVADRSMSLFVDTSIWYAAADSGDQSNSRAKTILKNGGEALVTSDHILVETWTLLHHKLGRNAAEQFWGGLRSGVAAIEAVGPADLEAAWEIGVSWRDQDFSIVDRSSLPSCAVSGLSAWLRSTRTLPCSVLAPSVVTPSL
jgi:predicted nucleic acid-binding protein